MDVYEVAARYRRDLQNREARAVRDLETTYRAAREVIERRVSDLERRVADRMAGGTVPVSWLWTSGRLQDTLTDIDGQLSRWSSGALSTVRSVVDGEASVGPTVAMELVRARLDIPDGVARSLVRVRPDELEQITGQLRAGAPLTRLFQVIAGEQVDRLQSAVVAAVASGQGPASLARAVAPVVDGGLTRARTIARTEMLRTSREALRASWQRQGGVVSGWRWWSTLDRTACPVCWAMHGTLHDLEEPFGTHPNCRCSMIPEIAPASVTGVPLDDLHPPELGVDRFAALPFQVQRRILGPGKHDAYLRGDITLPDVVRFRRDPTWGPTRSEAPLPPAARPVRTPPSTGRGLREREPEVTFTTDTPTPPKTRPSEIAEVFPARSGVKRQVHDGVTAALTVLDRLFIGLPVGRSGKPLPMTYSSQPLSSSTAFYQMRMNAVTRDYVGSRIHMSGDRPGQAAGTFLHEFGHFVDYELLDGMPATKVVGGDLDEWVSATIASTGYQAVKATGSRYFTKPSEIFARSFAQWAALRSGDNELLRSVIEDTWAGAVADGKPNPQWTDPDDFQPIAAALDTLFRKKGWIT